uniref:Uncharacterized protein n=1 Tax=Timema poppense TaxID=170557 RepID=A0A7R9CYZ1_TIMPO|nr:unnamed protein product [Timema poppensis]
MKNIGKRRQGRPIKRWEKQITESVLVRGEEWKQLKEDKWWKDLEDGGISLQLDSWSSSPVASLVVTDSSQPTSGSQHLGREPTFAWMESGKPSQPSRSHCNFQGALDYSDTAIAFIYTSQPYSLYVFRGRKCLLPHGSTAVGYTHNRSSRILGLSTLGGKGFKLCLFCWQGGGGGCQNKAFVRQRKMGKIRGREHHQPLGLWAASGRNKDAEWLNKEEVKKPIEVLSLDSEKNRTILNLILGTLFEEVFFLDVILTWSKICVAPN